MGLISKSWAPPTRSALEIFENWQLEVPDGVYPDYRKALKAEPREKIVLSWIVWPDRETAARAHKDMFVDPRMTEVGEMPFDSKCMFLEGASSRSLFIERSQYSEAEGNEKSHRRRQIYKDSSHLTLKYIQALPSIGCDHFALFTVLVYSPKRGTE
ncbi:MAG: hypothetical protein ACI88A_001321 [Paraglaciecola sp.]|jgi:uncharacterized protein YbaA (DUF1428 family)